MSVTSLHGNISHQVDCQNAPWFMANVSSIVDLWYKSKNTWLWNKMTGSHSVGGTRDLTRPTALWAPRSLLPRGILSFYSITMCSCYNTQQIQEVLMMSLRCQHNTSIWRPVGVTYVDGTPLTSRGRPMDILSSLDNPWSLCCTAEEFDSYNSGPLYFLEISGPQLAIFCWWSLRSLQWLARSQPVQSLRGPA